MIDRKHFFDTVRGGIRLTEKRVKALEYLLGRFEGEPAWGDWRHIAYGLATIAHETAYTFEPIVERGARSYFDKYDAGTRIGKRLGNVEEGDGYLFRGRGYVQLTGRTNYEKFGIADSPDDALDPDDAFRIMTAGMFLGAYTGRKLGDYIGGRKKDYRNARRVINGLDKAAEIAKLAELFETALAEAVPVAEPVAESVAEPEAKGWFSWLSPAHLDRVEDVAGRAERVSKSSVVMTVVTKAGGWFLMVCGFLWDNPVLLGVAAVVILAAVWYFKNSKDRETLRLTR